MQAPTRLCASCAERKTVRGIWYLVAQAGGDEPAFFCESCYTRQGRRGPAARAPMGPAPAAALAPPEPQARSAAPFGATERLGPE